MDERFRGHLGSINVIRIRSQRPSVFPNEAISNFKNQNLVAAPRHEYNSADHSFDEFNFLPLDLTPSNIATVSSENHDEEDTPEYSDFSDEVLRYINKTLMEDDVEEMACMLKDCIELQAAEKSFYEVLGKKYPPSPEQNVDENRESQDGSFMQNLSEHQSTKFQISSIPQSSCRVANRTMDGLVDSQNSTIHSQNSSIPQSPMPVSLHP